MPISSSRRRLTSPFVGPSASSTSSLLNTTSNTQIVRSGDEEGVTSDNGLETLKKKRGRVNTNSITFPILARIRPSVRKDFNVNHGTPQSKPRRRGRTTPLTTPTPSNTAARRLQHGDQRLTMGKDQFALKKIRFFNAPPKPAPLTLCFSYPGYDLIHRDVLDGIKKRRPIEVKRIKSIQFVDMNVVLGAAGVDNRWLITLKDHDARYKLFRDGLSIKGERVFLRRYDDVNFEDYRDYLRRKNTLQSDAHTAVQRLLSL
ncbi:uncharacterized protein LOC121405873 [Lytechinus variegatus]|uniref:uncharacterized protein LOC121405873 n=1 Tax=Lytechinus variegatus TaxID=7654 RepID=UPI001BB25017|nr:uncharacterized protein LOC121405873 [Lytechinus variegatus]